MVNKASLIVIGIALYILGLISGLVMGSGDCAEADIFIPDTTTTTTVDEKMNHFTHVPSPTIGCLDYCETRKHLYCYEQRVDHCEMIDQGPIDNN